MTQSIIEIQFCIVHLGQNTLWMVYSDYIPYRLMSCVHDGFIPLLWMQG